MSILSEAKEIKFHLRQLVTEMQEVLDDSDLHWETKYYVIFSAKNTKVVPALRSAGLSLDYYDPDTSYEEDARAFVNAVKELVG